MMNSLHTELVSDDISIVVMRMTSQLHSHSGAPFWVAKKRCWIRGENMVKSCCTYGCVNRLTKGCCLSIAFQLILTTICAGFRPSTERIGVLTSIVIYVQLILLVDGKATALFLLTMFRVSLNMLVVRSKENERGTTEGTAKGKR